MSVAEYVPTPTPTRFALNLPPVPLGSGRVRRPAELGADPFTPGPGQGRTGPDSGYALALAGAWEPIVVLADGERLEDAVAAAAAIAMTRAACAGRGPISADLEAAFTLLGYLDSAPDDLVAWRHQALELIAGDYQRLRRLVALPVHTLLLDPTDLRSSLDRWRELIPVWEAVYALPLPLGLSETVASASPEATSATMAGAAPRRRLHHRARTTGRRQGGRRLVRRHAAPAR